MLDMICENQGTIPVQDELGTAGPAVKDMAPIKGPDSRSKTFNLETPYSHAISACALTPTEL